MQPISFFFRAAARYPNATAVIAPDRQLTFAQLGGQVTQLAAYLAAEDPRPQTRVCVGCGNSIEHLIAILAVIAAGKTWVALNPRNGDPELQRIVEFTKPAALLLDRAMATRVDAGTVPVYLMDGVPADTALGRAAKTDAAYRPIYAPLDATVAIKFTGGTSGVPKGVMQPYRAWNTCIVSQRHAYGFTARDRYLVSAPLTHGASTYILPILGAGGAFVFPEDTRPATLLQTIADHSVTTFFAPPTMIQMLVDAAQTANRSTPSLRNVIYGGAPMRPNRIREAQDAFGPVIHATYGQTEAPQIITHLGAVEIADPDNLASAGRPSLMTEVRIMDADRRLRPAGEVGEVVVRGDLVMTGYLDMPDKTAETIVDGWLHTGDLGLLDERGYLFLRDRSRDVIITGGFNVYPSDVETVLARHPAVADCVVFGVPDDHWGEAVHAAIEPRPYLTPDIAAITAFLKHELGSVKTPKVVHVFPAMPKSPVGKVLKNAVRNQVLASLRAAEQPYPE